MSFFRSSAAKQTADTQPDDVDETRATDSVESQPADAEAAEPEESSAKVGESSTEGGESSTEGGESSTQGGESSTQGGESSTKIGARDFEELKADLIAAMKTVYDPEIPVDIYELGLIYAVDIKKNGFVTITMTLTTPMCPAAEILPPEVEAKCRAVDGVGDVQLDLVWEPPWDMEMMSDSARLELNL